MFEELSWWIFRFVVKNYESEDTSATPEIETPMIRHCGYSYWKRRGGRI